MGMMLHRHFLEKLNATNEPKEQAAEVKPNAAPKKKPAAKAKGN